MEMKCIRNMCGVTEDRRIDKVRNERVWERFGSKASLMEMAERGMLRSFRHMEKMIDKRMIKRVYKLSVNRVRENGKLRRRWKDCMGDILVEPEHPGGWKERWDVVRIGDVWLMGDELCRGSLRSVCRVQGKPKLGLTLEREMCGNLLKHRGGGVLCNTPS